MHASPSLSLRCAIALLFYLLYENSYKKVGTARVNGIPIFWGDISGRKPINYTGAVSGIILS